MAYPRHFTTLLASSLIMAIILATPLRLDAHDAGPCPAPDTGNGAAPTAPPPIVFSEVLPNPVGDDEVGEYFVLRNDGDADADLSGWSIRDASGRAFAPQGVAVGGNATRTFIALETNLQLNNGHEQLSLVRPDGSVGDSVGYDATNHEGGRYVRTPDGWQWIDPEAVPATPTPIVNIGEDKQKFDSVIIHALLPDPIGSDDAEWIELRNVGAESVVLAGWSIDDADGGSRPFVFGEEDVVAAGSVIRLLKERSRIILNNDGDEVRLFDPEGTLRDVVSYENPPEGSMFAKAGGAWGWIADGAGTPPPVEDVQVPSDLPETPPPPQAPTPAAPPETEAESSVSGMVTVPLGRLGKTIFLIAGEDGRGYKVRLYGTIDGPLPVGMRVTVRGKLHESATGPWIASRSAGVRLQGEGRLAFETRDIADLSSDDAGLPVAVSGAVTRGGTGWIRAAEEDGSAEIKIRLPPGADQDVAVEGTTVSAQGVIRSTSAGIELIVLEGRQLSFSRPVPEKSEETGLVEQKIERTREPIVLGTVEDVEGRPPYILMAAAAVLAGTIAIAAIRMRKVAAEWTG